MTTATATENKGIKAMTPKQAEKIKKAMEALGVHKFQHRSSYTLPDAQQNLKPVTHYVDDETLRYFKARIVRSWLPGECGTESGFLYAIVESLRKPGEEGNKTKRANVFDCFGSVIFQSEFQNSTEKAKKEVYAFLNGLDLAGHYIGKIKGEANRRVKSARLAMAALR